jgi:hypothetical protein
MTKTTVTNNTYVISLMRRWRWLISHAIRLNFLPATAWCLLDSTDKSTSRLDAVENWKIPFLLSEIDTTLPAPYPNNIPYICTYICIYIYNAVSYIAHVLNYQYQFKCSIKTVFFPFLGSKFFIASFHWMVLSDTTLNPCLFTEAKCF